MANGQVLLVGGEVVDEATGEVTTLSSVVKFDPATRTLEFARDLNVARTLAAAVQTPNDEVLLFGGESPVGTPMPSASSYRTEETRGLAAMPEARSFHTATRMGDGRVLIIGGDAQDGSPVTSVLIYE
jgi:N-acetylneuraminic acid mutarotase